MENLSEAAKYTLQFINQTQRSIFLTGKAGTGKTTLLKEIIESTHKNAVVVAPTGIAALNASGVTIQVVDNNGRIIFEETDTEFNIEKTLNVNSFQSGLYIVKIKTEEFMYSQKLIKQ